MPVCIYIYIYIHTHTHFPIRFHTFICLQTWDPSNKDTLNKRKTSFTTVKDFSTQNHFKEKKKKKKKNIFSQMITQELWCQFQNFLNIIFLFIIGIWFCFFLQFYLIFLFQGIFPLAQKKFFSNYEKVYPLNHTHHLPTNKDDFSKLFTQRNTLFNFLFSLLTTYNTFHILWIYEHPEEYYTFFMLQICLGRSYWNKMIFF